MWLHFYLKAKETFQNLCIFEKYFYVFEFELSFTSTASSKNQGAKAQRNIVFYNPSKILKSYFDMDDLDGFSYELRL